MSQTIKAIETTYAGCRVRSRLEARWAVFFDTLGIEWQYESQGYTADGYSYLPDFWLPNICGGCHAEVRPPGIANPGEQERLSAIVAGGLPGGLLLLGEIYRPEMEFKFTHLVRWHDQESTFYPHRYFGNDPFLYSHDVLFDHDGLIVHLRSGIQGRIGRGDSIWNWPDGGTGRALEPYEINANRDLPLQTALRAAKQARFEHGQTPR